MAALLRSFRIAQRIGLGPDFDMLEVYGWATPNGRKPILLLEELESSYLYHAVDIGEGQQFLPDFTSLNPNSKIPVLVDGQDVISESGAILIHLAEKSGRFLPSSEGARSQAIQWLFFQMASVGPMFGQRFHFQHLSEPTLQSAVPGIDFTSVVAYGKHRYGSETVRLLKVLNSHLADRPNLAGDYSIADMATYPWVDAIAAIVELTEFPHVQRWLAAIAERPAAQRVAAMNLRLSSRIR